MKLAAALLVLLLWAGTARADFQGTCPANTVVAGPATGPDAAPTCRALTPADVPAVAAPGTITNLNIPAGDQSIASNPLGNPLATKSSLNVVAHDTSQSVRQYLAVLGFASSFGVGQDAGGGFTGDRAALFVGIEAHPGSGEVWAENPAVVLFPGASVGHHQVSEMDMNNSLQNVDPTPGPAGLQFPNSSASGLLYTYGLVLENAGMTGTSALDIGGSAPWHRGMGCDQTNAVSDACYYDYSTSGVSLDLRGVHSVGIDFSNATLIPTFMRWGTPDHAGGFMSLGDYEFGGSGDTAIIVKDKGTVNGKWALQSMSADGRFRVYDEIGAVEAISIQPGSGTLVVGAGLMRAPLATPASSSALCTTGTLAWDANFVYVCTATNTWKRATLASF